MLFLNTLISLLKQALKTPKKYIQLSKSFQTKQDHFKDSPLFNCRFIAFLISFWGVEFYKWYIRPLNNQFSKKKTQIYKDWTHD